MVWESTFIYFLFILMLYWKVPTCVWIEPARVDYMSGLSDLVQISMKKCTRSVTSPRNCLFLDFSFKSEVAKMREVRKDGPRCPKVTHRRSHGAPMAFQGHPRIIILFASVGQVFQMGSRVGILKHLGCLSEHVGSIASHLSERMRVLFLHIPHVLSLSFVSAQEFVSTR